MVSLWSAAQAKLLQASYRKGERGSEMDASQPFHKMVCHFLSEHTRFLSRHLTYITRSGIATGLKRSGGFGFVPRQCTSEEVFYCSLDLRGKVVYDVGSNEGIFSLFSARAVGSGGTVVSFEPNPEAYRRTVRNLELNHFECQLYTVNTALGEARGARDMWCPSGETARSTLREDLADKYVRDGEKCSAFRVSIEKLDDLAGIKFPAPDFIKIDTEGHEAAVLCGAATHCVGIGRKSFSSYMGPVRRTGIANAVACIPFLKATAIRY